MITIEYSSMCFNQQNVDKKIEEAVSFLKNKNLQFGIQIHNSIEKNVYDKIINYKDSLPLTIHSPVFSHFFINLASSDLESSKNSIDTSVTYLNEINSNLLFFHGFFMTEKTILHDMDNYINTMTKSISSKFSLNNSFIMDPSYFLTDEFNKYKETFIKNLKIIKNTYPNLTICLENDFPGLGSGLQRPNEIFELIDDLWFDFGHFWCSSINHNFDFHEMTNKIISEKKIHGVHINHNTMKKNSPPETLKDSHTHLYHPSEQNLKPLILKLRDKGIDRFTLEIIDGDLEDLKILVGWLENI